MKYSTIFKKASLGLATLVAVLTMSGSAASAIPYTGDTTVASPVPAFNVFTGNMPAPAPLNGEPNFFRGRVPADGNMSDPTTPYTDPVSASCTNNQLIQLHVYVHNGASADANNNGSGPSVAHGTKVKVALPSNEASTFNSTATISATNAASVSDGLTINCNGKTVKLQYVAGSASQYSKGSGVVALPDTIVSSGAAIRSHNVPGDVWGCWDDRVYVVLTVKVVETPVTPVSSATCDLFTVLGQTDRKAVVNQFKYSVNNATLTKTVIVWGEGSSSTTVTDATKVIGQSHTYAADGTYHVVATLTFAGTNGATAPKPVTCSSDVTFSSTKPPVTPPVTPPTVLPNTGAGSLVGLFAGVSAIGATGYHFFARRRASN